MTESDLSIIVMKLVIGAMSHQFDTILVKKGKNPNNLRKLYQTRCSQQKQHQTLACSHRDEYDEIIQPIEGIASTISTDYVIIYFGLDLIEDDGFIYQTWTNIFVMFYEHDGLIHTRQISIDICESSYQNSHQEIERNYTEPQLDAQNTPLIDILNKETTIIPVLGDKFGYETLIKSI